MFIQIQYTVEPLLRGHPDERPVPLERPLDNVNLNVNVLISNPDERPPLLKGHFSDKKRGGLTRGVPLYCHSCCFCVFSVDGQRDRNSRSLGKSCFSSLCEGSVSLPGSDGLIIIPTVLKLMCHGRG